MSSPELGVGQPSEPKEDGPISNGAASKQDRVLRAVTDDGSFRVIAAETTATVRLAGLTQGTSPSDLQVYGELLTGAVLFRETMAPQLRVQGIVRSANGRTQMIADSHPSGDTRGMIQKSDDTGDIDLGPGATLRLMRSMPDGRLNQGVVGIPDDNGTISGGLMSYLQVSEQVVSMVAVGTDVDPTGAVSRAGGYLVQLLPGADRGLLTVMTERLYEYQTMAPWLSKSEFGAQWLLDELLYGIAYTPLETRTVRFHCWCDELRVVAALSRLPRQDIEQLHGSGETLEIGCEYCGKQYRIAPARLRGLLDLS